MKNLFFSFLVSVIIVALATSCNQRQVQPDLRLSVKMDTTIMYPVPETSPLWTCDGKRASYDKLLSMDSVPVVISLKKDTIISGKNLPAVAKVPPIKDTKPTKKSGAGVDLGWLWPILGFLLGVLLLILALALLAFVLLWLFRQFANQTNGNTNEHRREVAPVIPTPVPVTPGGEQNQQQTAHPNQTDIFNHQLNMAEELVGSQPIHRIVQRSKGGADGSWESEITIETKNDPVMKSDTKKEK